MCCILNRIFCARASSILYVTALASAFFVYRPAIGCLPVTVQSTLSATWVKQYSFSPLPSLSNNVATCPTPCPCDFS